MSDAILLTNEEVAMLNIALRYQQQQTLRQWLGIDQKPDEIDHIVELANTAGANISRSMIESAIVATNRAAQAVQEVAIAMERCGAYIRVRYTPRFAAMLISGGRFKTKRLRKKYGQE